MPSTNIKDYEKVIKSRYKDFTSKEKNIADCILSSGNKIKDFTITDFSNYCEVSEATISRFIKKCGHNNYREFINHLTESLITKNYDPINDKPLEEFNENDTLINLINKYNKRVNLAWSVAVSNLDISKVEESIEQLLNCNKIFVFGSGGSSYIASNIALKLLKLGFNVINFSEHSTLQAAAVTLDQNDVALVISHEGNNSKTLDILTLAKSSGCKIISCTSSSECLIAKASNINIVYGDINFPLEKKRGEIGIARIIQIAIIELIITALSLRID